MKRLKWFTAGVVTSYLYNLYKYVKKNPNNKDVVEFKESLTIARDDLINAKNEIFGKPKEKN